MDEKNEYAPDEVPLQEGHPSQAEGEDPARATDHQDPALEGHPSQAEGEPRGDDTDV